MISNEFFYMFDHPTLLSFTAAITFVNFYLILRLKFIRNHLLIRYTVVLLVCSQTRVDTCLYRVDTSL
jgi:hypothetical protein